MVNYLVFENAEDAAEASQTIFYFGAVAASNAGLKVTAEGIANYRKGVPQADTTTAWDTPQERADGKYVVAHPERHALAKRDPRMLAALLQQISSVYTTEGYQDDWFPSFD